MVLLSGGSAGADSPFAPGSKRCAALCIVAQCSGVLRKSPGRRSAICEVTGEQKALDPLVLENKFRATREKKMKKVQSILFAAAIGASAVAANAQFVIGNSTGLFTPSFRADGTGAGETFFGWSEGTWDGNVDTAAPNVDTLNPTPSVNPNSLAGASLTQNVVADIVSGSNNLFTNTTANVDLNLTIPTNGTPGTGFTTIIIQGRGLGSAMGTLNHLLFDPIGSVSPTFVVGQNALSPAATQWWAKYELVGNQSSYAVQVLGGPGASNMFPISANELLVDTYWSASSFAPDTAAVPEPAGAGLLFAAAGMLARRTRRQVRTISSSGGM
jgi:hypothetical protein